MAALVRKNSKCPEVKKRLNEARLRSMLPYWTHGIEVFWKTLRRLLVRVLLFFCAFSALPKFARYVNVVLASSWTPPPPPSSKRCISTVKHYCIATSSCIPPSYLLISQRMFCYIILQSSTTPLFQSVSHMTSSFIPP